MNTGYQNKRIAQSYKGSSVTTASPGQLVLMLYDGALKFMTMAEAGLKEPSPRTRNEVVNNNLIKAQNIIAELQNTLDMKVPGDFAKTMFNLYGYMLHQLQEANINKTDAPIKIVQGLLKDVRDSWEEMLKKQNAITGVAAAAPTPLAQDRANPMEPASKIGGGLNAEA